MSIPHAASHHLATINTPSRDNHHTPVSEPHRPHTHGLFRGRRSKTTLSMRDSVRPSSCVIRRGQPTNHAPGTHARAAKAQLLPYSIRPSLRWPRVQCASVPSRARSRCTCPPAARATRPGTTATKHSAKRCALQRGRRRRQSARKTQSARRQTLSIRATNSKQHRAHLRDSGSD